MLSLLKHKNAPTLFQFQLDFTLEDRQREARSVRKKYPDRVPCVVEVRQKEPDDGLKLDKKKYLVPNDVTLSQFAFVLRKRMHLNPSKAIFMMIDNQMISGSVTMRQVYAQHKGPDDFLYVHIGSENTFGSPFG